MLQRIQDGFVGVFLGIVISALVAAYFNMQPKPVETPAPAIAQSDGSQVLERKPDAKAKSPSKIPKGGKVERIIHGEIAPHKEPGALSDCPVCKFDLTLVRMPDDTQRVILWSDTGTVLGGLDVPTVPININRGRKWAAGVSRGTGGESWGGWLDRDLGWVRLGGEVNKTGDNQYEGRIKIGLTF